jgi:hypothetical protein
MGKRIGRVLIASGAFVAVIGASHARTSDQAHLTMQEMFQRLDVEPEQRNIQFDRKLFKYGIDSDGDCKDTRAEILEQQSTIKVTFRLDSGRCKVSTGRWLSWYDGRLISDPKKIEIDHLVALKEAWESGAFRWTDEELLRFANDLSAEGNLIAVSKATNRRKSDSDPSEWIPTASRCRYIHSWILVKFSWNLAIDRDEQDAISDRLKQDCKQILSRRRP